MSLLSKIIGSLGLVCFLIQGVSAPAIARVKEPHEKNKPTNTGAIQALPTTGVVKRVIDGDTLLLEGGIRIRLIGVDTPEFHASPKLSRDAERSHSDQKTIQALGKRSSEFTKWFVCNPSESRTRKIRIEYDPINAVKGHKDKYGRLLAYVYFNPDLFTGIKLRPKWAQEAYRLPTAGRGELNGLLLEAGYASAYTQIPISKLEEYRQYEKSARYEGRGLWGGRQTNLFSLYLLTA